MSRCAVCTATEFRPPDSAFMVQCSGIEINAFATDRSRIEGNRVKGHCGSGLGFRVCLIRSSVWAPVVM